MKPPAPPCVVVLAHVPPPFHGQSFMVARLLDALADARSRDPRLRVIHVDSRYSRDLSDLGQRGIVKAALALRYAARAALAGWRNRKAVLYFAPAPGKRGAFWRDCLVLAICRPFFSRMVYHWHAAGLNRWLIDRGTAIERLLADRILADHETSIVMVAEKQAEVVPFRPRRTLVIPYGVPDPCPDFAERLSEHRKRRAVELTRRVGPPLQLLYLSTASRDKGVFDALEAWRALNLAPGIGRPCRLIVGGAFPHPAEEIEFQRALASAREEVFCSVSADQRPAIDVELRGWVEGARKRQAFEDGDIFLFPSTYPTESFGVVLVEAALFGLPCVSYQPLIGANGMPESLHRRVCAGDTAGLARAATDLAGAPPSAETIRAEALAAFDPARFARRMVDALLHPAESVESDAACSTKP